MRSEQPDLAWCAPRVAWCIAVLLLAARPAAAQSAAAIDAPAPPRFDEMSASPEATRLLSSAQAHYQSGDYGAALRDAEAAFALGPDDLGALRLVGRLRLLRRDFAGAAEALQEALRQSPHDADLREWLATASRARRSSPSPSRSQPHARPQPQPDARTPRGDGRHQRPAPLVERWQEPEDAEPSSFHVGGAAAGLAAGLVLGGVTSESSGGVMTGLLVTGAATLAGGSLGAGLDAPADAAWSPWLAAGSGLIIAGVGLVAGDRALTLARRGDPDARSSAVHADMLIVTGLLVTGGAATLALVRSNVDLAANAKLRVAPAVGPDQAGVVALGRF